MLNGIDPLLIVTFTNKGVVDFFGGADSLLGGVIDAVGVPIPLYLGEKFTQIYVESETRGIDITTTVDPTMDKDELTGEVEAPKTSQTSTDSQLTINLVTVEGNIMLTALLALMDQVVKRLVTQEYSITYINGPIVIFNALLGRFSTSRNRSDNKIQIEMTLSTAAKKSSPTEKPPIDAVPKNTGAIPITAGG